jgi:hypothetical protein
MKTMRHVVILILLLMNGLSVWSQTDRLDSLLRDILGDDRELMQFLNPPSSYCYLYGGIAGDNKTYYAGRELGDDMYSLNGNLYFFHSKGFFIGASGSWYSELGPGYNTTVLSAGINTPLNKKKSLLFRASYSRYLYNNSDPETEYVYTNSLGTGLSLRNNWIGGRLSINILFGKDFGMNLTPGIFSRITLVKFGKYNKIRLEPEILAFIGSETVEYETNSGQQPDSQSLYVTEDAYGLLNTQFTMPVCIYLGDFDFELGYSVNMPVTQDENITYPVSSFFSFSIGYLFPLN